MLDPSFLNAVNTSIIPSADNTYDFGENTTPLRWRNGYFAGFIDVGSLQIGGTEVIDSSRNLKNIASATITSQLQIGSGTVSTDALADLFGDDTKFLRLRNPTDADDTNTIRNPPNIYLSGNVWDSANTTSVERHMGLFMEISDLNTYYLKFKNDSEQEILSLDGSGNMLISGDLQINGNDIKDSGGATRITLGATISISATLDLGNHDLKGVNNLIINDPGPHEGISWYGGNWEIFESPNDLSNASGNLQFYNKSDDARRMTLDTSGNLWVAGNLEATGDVYSTNPGSYSQVRLRQWGLQGDGHIYIESAAGKYLYLTDSWGGSGVISIAVGAANSDTTTRSSPWLEFRTAYYDGSSNVYKSLYLRGVMINTTPAYKLSLYDNDKSTELFYINNSGNTWIKGDLQVGGNDIKDSGGNIRITLGSIVQFNSQIQFPNDQGQAILLPSADNQDFHIENVNGKFRIVRTGVDYAITVDGNNKRVGIWNDSPSYAFDVSGTFRATGDSVIGGDLQVNGGDIKDSGGAARIQFLSNFTRFLQKAVNVFDGNDVAAGTENSGYLLIGDPASTHLAIDNNEIMAKADGTTAGTLNLQLDGGAIVVGANLYPNSSNSKKLGLYTRVWQEVYTYRLFITKDSYSNSYEFFYHDWDTSPSDWSHAWAMHVKTKGGFFVHLDLDNNASSYPDNDTFTVTFGSSYTRKFALKNNGYGYATGGWTTFSSRRFKENISEMKIEDPIEIVSSVKPRRFKFKEEFGGHEDWGFIAEEMPEIVQIRDPEGNVEGYDTTKYVAILSEALKQIYKKLNKLEVRVNELEEKVNSVIAS